MARGAGVPCRTHGKDRHETWKEQSQGIEKVGGQEACKSHLWDKISLGLSLGVPLL